MCGTRGSNPPKPHYYHLFIHSIHSPDNYFIYQILFIEFYLFIYLFIKLYLFNIYLFIYLFIYSWCFDDLSDRALKPRGRNLSFGMSLCMRKPTLEVTLVKGLIGVSDQV